MFETTLTTTNGPHQRNHSESYLTAEAVREPNFTRVPAAMVKATTSGGYMGAVIRSRRTHASI
jgi:hypothetical protein